MAPFSHANEVEDFILTISDDDQVIPHSDNDDEREIINGSSQRTQKKQSRKRNIDTYQSPNDSLLRDSIRPSKKRKGSHLTKEKVTSHHALAGNQEQTQAPTTEEDDAVASDFEFQIEDVNTGVIEDFGHWVLGTKSTGPPERKRNKGVDTDELIRRYQQNRPSTDNGNRQIVSSAEEIGESGEDDSLSEEEDATLDDQEGDDRDEEDVNDETLAEDGFGMGAGISEDDSDRTGATKATDIASSSDDDSIAEPVPHPDDEISDDSPANESDDPEESVRRQAFYAPEEKGPPSKSTHASADSFQNMSLSRPILRGLAAIGFSRPTPIQNKTVPVALLGKDIVGGAVTGSGKTAAFIVPILERLLYRPRKIPTSRVAILLPTRELAVQCFSVARKLASFTDITFCQMVGGFSLREQENVLKTRPDVIIATPGRFIDHMRNSASFTVDTLEILVLDEADRMLEDGFADELNEILATIPKSRQTMLFSATMTEKVDKLIRIGLNRPVRLIVDAKKQTVGTLVQEFIRLRPGQEDKRLGYLLYLCENVYTDKVIIFFRQRKEAHRIRIIFGLCGIKATELHGSMSQEQRISSLTAFRSSVATHLLATDVAARGLDIPRITCVLNYSAPQSPIIYLHRVGRTARAGASGRSCTLAAESDRKVVKEVVKAARAQGSSVVSRSIDAAVADASMKKAEALQGQVNAILAMEKEERALGEAEREVRKGENLVDFADEIKSRVKRTWFESEKDKKAAKLRGAKELNDPRYEMEKTTAATRKYANSGKPSGKEKKKMDRRKERAEGRVWKKGRSDAHLAAAAAKNSNGKKRKKKESATKTMGSSTRGNREKSRKRI